MTEQVRPETTIHQTHFLAAGRSREATDRYMAELDRVRMARVAFAQEHNGTDRFIVQGDRLIGVAEADPFPPGWKRMRNIRGGMEPDRRTKHGRAVAVAMEALSNPPRSQVANPKSPFYAFEEGATFTDDGPLPRTIMDETGTFFDEVSLYTITGPTGPRHHHIILVRHHEGEEPVCPVDAKRLAMSEVWAMREAAKDVGQVAHA